MKMESISPPLEYFIRRAFWRHAPAMLWHFLIEPGESPGCSERGPEKVPGLLVISLSHFRADPETVPDPLGDSGNQLSTAYTGGESYQKVNIVEASRGTETLSGLARNCDKEIAKRSGPCSGSLSVQPGSSPGSISNCHSIRASLQHL